MNNEHERDKGEEDKSSGGGGGGPKLKEEFAQILEAHMPGINGLVEDLRKLPTPEKGRGMTLNTYKVRHVRMDDEGKVEVIGKRDVYYVTSKELLVGGFYCIRTNRMFMVTELVRRTECE